MASGLPSWNVEAEVPRPPYNRHSLQSQLTSKIMDMILERGLAAGDPLPTEKELADFLAVGRNSVRETLKTLQALGVVETRHGHGTFVSTSVLGPLTTNLSFHGRLSLRGKGDIARQLIEVNQALEVLLISTAVIRLSAEDLATLAALAEEMEQREAAGEPSEQPRADFHRLLFGVLGNDILFELMGIFSDVSAGISHPDETAATHLRLLEAIETGQRSRRNAP